jgi:peroxiredoxin
MLKGKIIWMPALVPFLIMSLGLAYGVGEEGQSKIYAVDKLKPVDSQTHLKTGDMAPDFMLPSVAGDDITLRHYRGGRNVVISFVPAAWTAVCSDQWPGYNIAKELFEKHDAMLLGVSVDNIPTLYAWTQEMGGLWFPVLSDFWPHGKVAQSYGVLRSDGTSERALFVIDKQGVIRYIDVHDINDRPRLEELMDQLEKLQD